MQSATHFLPKVPVILVRKDMEERRDLICSTRRTTTSSEGSKVTRESTQNLVLRAKSFSPFTRQVHRHSEFAWISYLCVPGVPGLGRRRILASYTRRERFASAIVPSVRKAYISRFASLLVIFVKHSQKAWKNFSWDNEEEMTDREG
jgi:hypothetical protein